MCCLGLRRGAGRTEVEPGRKLDELHREIGKISTAGERRAERSARFAAKPKMPAPYLSALGRVGAELDVSGASLPAPSEFEKRPGHVERAMSAIGTKRTWVSTLSMSALGGEADILNPAL